MSSRRNWVLITIALGILLNPLNSSMISVAIARLQSVFHLTFTDASWIISTYYLASAIAQPVMGKVADRVGRKKVFLIGLVLAALSSLAAPFAPTFTWLIVFRLIQSAGSGAIFPAGMAIVRQWITDRQASALAFLGIFSSGAAAFGPSIGGFVMHWGDWPALFIVNFPFIIISFVMALWLLPPDRFDPVLANRGETVKSRLVPLLMRDLDAVGILSFAATIVLLLVFLLSLSTHPVWWTGAAGVAALLFFGWRELRAARPFIDLRMFRSNKAFSWIEIQFVTVNLIFYCIFFGMPEYLQEAAHFNAQQAGLIMLCVAGSSLIVSPITGQWVERSGSRPPLLLAGFCLTVGSILFVTLGAHTPIIWLLIVLFILGLSNGLNNIGLQTALFAVVPAATMGTASGLFMTARYMGTILSTVLLGFVFEHAIGVREIHRLGIIDAVFGALVIVMSLRVPKGRHRKAQA
ncbi:MFS transporter [Alicyclobacillus cycloheptanicus]|nr:MFS transporter [Alicyclobacillus cycloheptanicus]